RVASETGAAADRPGPLPARWGLAVPRAWTAASTLAARRNPQDGVVAAVGVRNALRRLGIVLPVAVDDQAILVLPRLQFEDRAPLVVGALAKPDPVPRPLREVSGHHDLARALGADRERHLARHGRRLAAFHLRRFHPVLPRKKAMPKTK